MKRALRCEVPPDVTPESIAQGERLSRQIARWVVEHSSELAEARPNMVALINRRRNNWQPLYTVAEIMGGGWPDRARAAMAALTAADDDDADSLSERLLGDIRAVFQATFDDCVANGREPEGWLSSETLVQRLISMEGHPWAEMGKQDKPLTKNRLARMLKPFGVLPRWVGPEGARARGYLLTSFEEPFDRYLSPLLPGRH
jgi:hypothetical protein